MLTGFQVPGLSDTAVVLENKKMNQSLKKIKLNEIKFRSNSNIIWFCFSFGLL